MSFAGLFGKVAKIRSRFVKANHRVLLQFTGPKFRIH